MTFFEEKIEELKTFSAKAFKTTVQKIDSGSRRREVSDARKCVALMASKLYPEVSGSHVSRLIKKERSATRKLLRQGRVLFENNGHFRNKFHTVESAIKKPRCHYCKTII